MPKDAPHAAACTNLDERHLVVCAMCLSKEPMSWEAKNVCTVVFSNVL
jgi:hypothetical protein